MRSFIFLLVVTLSVIGPIPGKAVSRKILVTAGMPVFPSNHPVQVQMKKLKRNSFKLFFDGNLSRLKERIKQKRHSRSRFEENGTIGKTALWLFVAVYLLGLLGGLLNFNGTLFIATLLSGFAIAFVLAIIGLTLGGKNKGPSKAVLLISIINIVIGGAVILLLELRGE